MALSAWQLMNGLDFQALPVVVELLGIEDVEQLIYLLQLIRNRLEKSG